MNKEFNVGDEVLVFKRNRSDWFLKSLRENSFIKGTIIKKRNKDYGYHGSSDYILVYEVKGIDGLIYQADYKTGYNPCALYTKDDIINTLQMYISGGVEYLEKTRKKVMEQNFEYQMLIDRYNNVCENGYQKKKGVSYARKS